MMPTMAPIMAAALTPKQKSWSVCKAHHLADHMGIFFCAMCMDTGRKTVRGQNPRAPMTPAYQDSWSQSSSSTQRRQG